MLSENTTFELVYIILQILPILLKFILPGLLSFGPSQFLFTFLSFLITHGKMRVSNLKFQTLGKEQWNIISTPNFSPPPPPTSSLTPSTPGKPQRKISHIKYCIKAGRFIHFTWYSICTQRKL